MPEGENVKIPVAIKVLREGSGIDVQNEILDEAKIMATVEHPNLLQMLAICMTDDAGHPADAPWLSAGLCQEQQG